MYDSIVIGGGPAGLTAAIYLRRAGKQVLLLEREAYGGQMTFSPKIENYPGISSIAGSELADRMLAHALDQGMETEFAEAGEIVPSAGGFTVRTDAGDFAAKTVILAAGAKHRLPGVPGEEKYLGKGISFCAVCDGAFYAGKPVAVIGGGNSAMQEALQLSELASSVTVVQNLAYFTGEQRLAELIEKKENVSAIFGATVERFTGEGEIDGLDLVVTETGERRHLAVDGVFVAVGLSPETKPFASLLDLDRFGYAVADESAATKTPGLFVAGDCRAKAVRQISTAASDGAAAALAACAYLDRN
ncbi:MAG: FAD-dependent oxidoreductase [Clostridia bacterium]|nr:FAD-dependent oxidoreductase [Clostridia bacterium]